MSGVKIPVIEKRRGDEDAILGYIGQPSQSMLAALVKGEYNVIPKVRRVGDALQLVSIALTKGGGYCEVVK